MNRREKKKRGTVKPMDADSYLTMGIGHKGTNARQRPRKCGKKQSPETTVPLRSRFILAIDVAMTRESEKLGIDRTFAMKRNPIAIASSDFRWLSNSRP